MTCDFKIGSKWLVAVASNTVWLFRKMNTSDLKYSVRLNLSESRAVLLVHVGIEECGVLLELRTDLVCSWPCAAALLGEDELDNQGLAGT